MGIAAGFPTEERGARYRERLHAYRRSVVIGSAAVRFRDGTGKGEPSGTGQDASDSLCIARRKGIRGTEQWYSGPGLRGALRSRQTAVSRHKESAIRTDSFRFGEGERRNER